MIPFDCNPRKSMVNVMQFLYNFCNFIPQILVEWSHTRICNNFYNKISIIPTTNRWRYRWNISIRDILPMTDANVPLPTRIHSSKSNWLLTNRLIIHFVLHGACSAGWRRDMERDGGKDNYATFHLSISVRRWNTVFFLRRFRHMQTFCDLYYCCLLCYSAVSDMSHVDIELMQASTWNINLSIDQLLLYRILICIPSSTSSSSSATTTATTDDDREKKWMFSLIHWRRHFFPRW